MQHCSNAKQILSSISSAIDSSHEVKDKSQAATQINDAYIKKVLGMTQQ
jgi:hypothetical protein